MLCWTDIRLPIQIVHLWFSWVTNEKIDVNKNNNLDAYMYCGHLWWFLVISVNTNFGVGVTFVFITFNFLNIFAWCWYQHVAYWLLNRLNWKKSWNPTIIEVTRGQKVIDPISQKGKFNYKPPQTSI